MNESVFLKHAALPWCMDGGIFRGRQFVSEVPISMERAWGKFSLDRAWASVFSKGYRFAQVKFLVLGARAIIVSASPGFRITEHLVEHFGERIVEGLEPQDAIRSCGAV